MKYNKALLLIILMLSLKVTAQETKIKLIIDNQTELTATMVDNSSVDAFIELLNKGALTIEMRDYGNMEKVGDIGTSLPRNDEQITTEPGDIILYQGSALVIYYAPNSYSFTRLGKIDNITQSELKAILGEGDVTVSLELLGEDVEPSFVSQKTDDTNSEVFPNPVNSILHINEPIESATLLSTDGRQIVKTEEQSIDMSDLKSGLYLLKVESNRKKTTTHKIIKK